jgi:hypothetical protein
MQVQGTIAFARLQPLAVSVRSGEENEESVAIWRYPCHFRQGIPFIQLGNSSGRVGPFPLLFVCTYVN